jgi:hypothetical protein
MKPVFMRVRLKASPDKWVGKKSPTYAFHSDQDPRPLQENAYWFVPEKNAKVWTTVSALRRVVREGRWRPIYLNPGTSNSIIAPWGLTVDPEVNIKPQTYSRYEVVFQDGTVESLDKVITP